MTTVDVDEYDDLRGDQVINSREKDAVLDALGDGASAVLWLEDWLVGEKELEPIANIDALSQLFPGRIVAETEKAYLFTTTSKDDPDAAEPGTDWVPKSSSRAYVGPDNDDDVDDQTPQRGLFDFNNES